MVTIKSIHRLFYLNTILLIIVYLSPYVVPYIYPEIPYVELLAISAIMLTLVIIFYTIILMHLSVIAKRMNSPIESLAEKMMSCKLRIENGSDYCVKCPDSYTCASGKEGTKG